MKSILYKYIIPLLISVGIWSCHKEQNILQEGGRVSFSTDTVFFDTVFTALKTSTRIVKIYNDESVALKVNVHFKEGNNSYFRLNVDGRVGTQANDITILAYDSATVFINAVIDSTSEHEAYVVEDALQVQVNSNNFEIPVLAYAQNAYFLYDSVLTTTTFTSERPYVIIKSALVAEGEVLTVEPGARIYMHQDSRLFVQGTLKINGTLEEPVYIQSDRIDRDIYVGSENDMPGEWGGLYFLESSHDNEINYAIIKNGGLSTRVGESMTLAAMIQVDKDITGSSTPKLKMTNTVLKNGVQYGIVSFGGSIYAENCVIVNCQMIAVALLEGGRYEFNDCTIGIFGGIPLFGRSLESAALLAQNYYEPAPGSITGRALDLKINNCIVSGNFDNEFIINAKETYPAAVQVKGSLIQQRESIPSWVIQEACYYNLNPQFVDISKSDFHLSATSPLIGQGILSGTLSADLDGIERNTPTSIGAYEYVPAE